MTAIEGIAQQAGDLEQSWAALGRFFLSRRRIAGQGLPPAAAELSPVQLHALTLLLEQPLRIGVLSDLLGLAESTATRMVDRLEDLGLARRILGKPDRRSVMVELTRHGSKVAREIRSTRCAFLGEMLEGLEPAEREELVRLMTRVAEVLGRQADPEGSRAS